MRYMNWLVAALVASTSAPFAERALAEPLPTDPNLVLWMRADQGVTGTAPVTKIDDSSDNDNDMFASIAFGPTGPVLATRTFPTGDHPVIRFDGSAAFELAPHATALNLDNATIYMVATEVNGFFPAQCYVSNYGPSFLGYAVGISDTQSNFAKFYTSHGSFQSDLEPFTLPDETPFMLTTSWTSTGSKNAYLDGGPAFHENGAYPTYAADNNFVIGGLNTHGSVPGGEFIHQRLLGDIAEILIYNNVDAAQRTAVESYLRQKYFQAAIPGDYNGNGRVDAADYVAWRKDPASFGGNPAGYNTWRAHFGETAGSGSVVSGAAVPEPGCCVLAALALLGSTWLPRRRAATI
jgi:hypothetical protein